MVKQKQIVVRIGRKAYVYSAAKYVEFS